MKSFHSFHWLIVWLVSAIFSLALAESQSTHHEMGVHPQVEALLQGEDIPDGIVFDIETLDKNALSGLAGYVSFQVKRLKQTFPDVDIAIVSHGVEEFALQKQAQQQYSKLHSNFSKLVDSEGVSVHVCGAVAGLGKLSKEDFPEFVSFSDSGMAQLNDYKAIGYRVITIHSLTDPERKSLFESPQEYLPAPQP
ncbi:DsrE family protein [Thiomicrorhabdus sediminis]|uniref:DsrE family protein n=1 Tax=Thiomicrorhabdus sediminis TaxID=2580412 RepID=A0A4V1HI35_9GAMM|nr:DsrE family protein [Thiomicrorhabdus sediminis]